MAQLVFLWFFVAEGRGLTRVGLNYRFLMKCANETVTIELKNGAFFFYLIPFSSPCSSIIQTLVETRRSQPASRTS